MNREEKNQQTKRRIMDRALKEFSEQGYGASSVNAICSAQVRAQITKPEAIETFRQFQNFINANFQVSELTMREFEAHEQGCRSCCFSRSPVRGQRQ